MITHRAFRCLYLYAAAALLCVGNLASAQTTSDGDVYVYQSGMLLAEDPFSDFLEGVQAQSVNDELLPTAEQFFYERGQDVIVGRTSYGVVRVSGGDDLRYDHLILGGTEEDFDGDDVNTNTLVGVASGHGVFRAEQISSSFNNHPLIIPAQYQSFTDPEATRFPVPATGVVDIDYDGDGSSDRTLTIVTERDSERGFDAIVGLTGTGEMYLNTGARMEIQDAFIVAYGAESSGYVEVDGVGTYLAVYGGLNPNAPTQTRADYATGSTGIHQMIIGAYGDGEMRITGGADVDAFYGAAIGVTQSDGDDQVTVSLDSEYIKQGSGRVIVDGPGSSWNISITSFNADRPPSGITDGGLAIGQFDESAIYNAEYGQGYLSVRSDAVVRVYRYTDSGTGGQDAVVRVGRFGTLDMRGGRFLVQDQFISDGLIQARENGTNTLGGVAAGGGQLVFGTFENRAFGEVRVSNGQALSVVTNSPTGNLQAANGVNFNAANFGLIEVIGGDVEGSSEIEFDREIDGDLITQTPFISQIPRTGFYEELFLNAAGTGDDPSGLIVGQQANLRFRSGIWNSGKIAFVGGDNIVSGRVMNDWDGADPRGQISIANQSTVTFEDTVTNDGTITLTDDSNAVFLGGLPGLLPPVPAYSGVGDLNIVSTGDVHVAGDFELGGVGVGGTLRLYVEDFTVDGYSHLVIEGDGDFSVGGTATIEILGNAMGPLNAGDAIDLITVLGVADFTGTTIQTLVATAPGTVLLTDTSGPALTLIVASAIGTLPGDYNGDGTVDASDYTVWRDNLGGDDAILFGNGNNDGVIDAADYAIWSGNYGSMLAAPAPTAGLGAVPEPAALTLLGSLALFGGRRRRG